MNNFFLLSFFLKEWFEACMWVSLSPVEGTVDIHEGQIGV